MKPYEHIDHPADIGLRIYGSSLEELFRNAALGLFDTMVDPAAVRTPEQKKIALSADTAEELLVSWLNELLFVFETEQRLFSVFDVRFTGPAALVATVHGEPFDEQRHERRSAVKAATYHNLGIRNEQGIWQAEVVLDV